MSKPIKSILVTGVAPMENHAANRGEKLLGNASSVKRRPDGRVFGCLIGRPGAGCTPLLLLVNGEPGDIDFMLPAGAWQALLDSAQPRGEAHWQGAGDALYPLPGRSLVLLAAPGHGIEL